MLVCEQYPSIHGQRYLVFGSTRVFASIQSLVPGFAFSVRIKSDCAREIDLPLESSTALDDSPSAAFRSGFTPATTPAPNAPLSRLRRFVMLGSFCMETLLTTWASSWANTHECH